MPEPGSKAYEIQRRTLRNELDDAGIPDKNATEAANDELQKDSLPRGSAVNATERVVGPAGEREESSGDPGAVFEVRSSAFSDGAVMQERYSKEGGNEAPPLEWSELPDGTAELALVVDDLDADGFVHWLVTGISPDAGSIGGGAVAGREHPNGYGERGYGGPRPPIGDPPHRYRFQLFALPEPLSVPDEPDPGELRQRLEENALATGTLVARFGR